MIGRAYGITCPHCNGKLTTKMTRMLNHKLQERYLQCSNVTCAATYKAFVELRELVSTPLNQTELFND